MSARTPKPLFPWRRPGPPPLRIDVPPADPTPFQNAEKLVEAVNGAASTVAALHVAFMALSAYLAVTVWGATHVDFLKESPVKLPLIDVQVDLTSFYGVAPWLYVLVHLNLLIQFYLLARKVWAFAAAAEYPQLADRLFVFPFVHYLLHRAGRFVRPLLAIAVFASVIAVPLFVLLFIQIKFLAYHSEAITWSQRLAVWADAGLLLWMWPRVASRSGKYLDGYRPEPCQHKIKAPWLVSSAMLIVVLGSFFLALVALVPSVVNDLTAKSLATNQYDEADGLEARLVRWISSSDYLCKLLLVPARQYSSELLRSKSSDISRQYVPSCVTPSVLVSGVDGLLGPTLWITAWLFDVTINDRVEFWLNSDLRKKLLLFVSAIPNRYLGLRGEVLLKEMPAPEVLHVLQGDIPYIFYDEGDAGSRQRCRKIDEVQFARIECAAASNDLLTKIVPLKLVGRDLRGADLKEAVLPLSDLREAQLQGASLVGAQLQGASLVGAKLQSVNFSEAQLQGVSLVEAQLQRARFDGAQLQGASLNKAQLQGVSLLGAQLQGASLDKAQMQGARLDEAKLQGASLNDANLQGVSLFATKMYGASLNKTQMHGASLFGAQMQGAYLGGVNLQAAVLINVAINGSEGGVNGVAAIFSGVDVSPLDAAKSLEIINAARPFLAKNELGFRQSWVRGVMFEEFEKRIKSAQLNGVFSTVISGGCFGAESIGCSEALIIDRFRNEQHFPALVDLVCKSWGDDSAAAAAAGVRVIELLRGDFGSGVGRLRLGFDARLLSELAEKKCPNVEKMPEIVKEHLGLINFINNEINEGESRGF